MQDRSKITYIQQAVLLEGPLINGFETSLLEPHSEWLTLRVIYVLALTLPCFFDVNDSPTLSKAILLVYYLERHVNLLPMSTKTHAAQQLYSKDLPDVNPSAEDWLSLGPRNHTGSILLYLQSQRGVPYDRPGQLLSARTWEKLIGVTLDIIERDCASAWMGGLSHLPILSSRSSLGWDVCSRHAAGGRKNGNQEPGGLKQIL
ncbi:hypothetical protein C8R42DRAFT_642916 [Lentinula raphanica]|nr:hypothetical protein C8R42DRAFT_642916 [Lentinula raphanica]